MPNPRPSLPYVEEDDVITYQWANSLIDEIAACRLLDVAGLNCTWFPDGVVLEAAPEEGQAHFYTTGTITAGSHTGSTVSTFAHTQGSGNARPCLRDPATGILTPDQNAGDVVIYNDVEAAILPGHLVKAALVDGVWVVDLKGLCS